MGVQLQQRCGTHWLDAPVSGGVGGAEQGSLAIMVGGDAAQLDQVRSVLAAYSAARHPDGGGQGLAK